MHTQPEIRAWEHAWFELTPVDTGFIAGIGVMLSVALAVVVLA